jgi:hypothetical protein
MILRLGLAAALAWSAATSHAQSRPPGASQKLRFDVSFIPQAHDGPITGRVFVMVTRTVDKVPEPRAEAAAGRDDSVVDVLSPRPTRPRPTH